MSLSKKHWYFKHIMETVSSVALQAFMALYFTALIALHMATINIRSYSYAATMINILKLFAPYALIAIAMADLAKWVGMIHRLFFSDAKTRQKERAKLKETYWINVIQPLISAAGFVTLAITWWNPLMAPWLSTMAIALIVTGAALAAIRYGIKSWKYRKEQNATSREVATSHDSKVHQQVQLKSKLKNLDHKVKNNAVKAIAKISIAASFSVFAIVPFFLTSYTLIHVLIFASAVICLSACFKPALLSSLKEARSRKSKLIRFHLMATTVIGGVMISVAALLFVVPELIIVGLAFLALSTITFPVFNYIAFRREKSPSTHSNDNAAQEYTVISTGEAPRNLLLPSGTTPYYSNTDSVSGVEMATHDSEFPKTLNNRKVLR